MRSEDDIAGEGRLVGEPKFHSWDKYTTTLTNIYSWGVMIALIIYIPMYLQVLDIPFARGSQSEHKTLDALSTSCEKKSIQVI